MNALESVTRPLRWFMAVLLLALTAGCGGGGGGQGAVLGNLSGAVALTAKAITSYSINGAAGIINETAKTIAVTVPFGTNPNGPVALFTTTGTGVAVGAAAQTSGTTANNFTGPVLYTVTAADSSTATYTVTVTVASNVAKALAPYVLGGVAGIINETAKTIAVPMPFGTNVTSLIATFSSSGQGAPTVAGVNQASGVTANNFTNPVLYVVTAADASTATYTVTVTVASNSAKAIAPFTLAGIDGIINETAKTIAVTMPFGTNVTSLVATFTSTGQGAPKVAGVSQTSGVTANNFTTPVQYVATAADASTATYTVTVTVAANSAKAIAPFTLAGVPGIINESLKTIAVPMPFGTNVTSLIATFTSSGQGVPTVAGVNQLGGVTPNNFTNPVTYVVTAADSSVAAYTVTVTVAANSAKAIAPYTLAGVPGIINESLKTIALPMPFGTSLANLIATFTTTGQGVPTVAGVNQLTGVTPNNFSNPVLYVVTAADNSTATYTVTATVAANSAKAIAPFTLAGVPGIINESLKTISVPMPFGTDLTTLIAAFTSTGQGVPTVAGVNQLSGVTPNDFTNPVLYVVTAADNTTATYTVTVTTAQNSAKTIAPYSLAGVPGSIDETAKTIAVSMPFGTNVTNLVATFTSRGQGVPTVAGVNQMSGVTPNDFSNPVSYLVTAVDNSTATYVVTVTVAANSAKAIAPYALAGVTAAINEGAKTIAVTLPAGTDVTNLIATFTSTGQGVPTVAGVNQLSGVTPNDFTAPKAYLVTAADNSTATYTVTVTVPVALAINLRGIATFGLASRAGMTSTGVTVVNGDVALYPLATCTDSTGGPGGASRSCLFKTYPTDGSITGMTVNGSIYFAADPFDNGGTANSVSNDLQIAWNEGKAKAITQPVGFLGGAIGGKTIQPGIYKEGSTLTLAPGTTATFDALGDPNAVFMIQVGSDLIDSGTLLLPSQISMINNAQARNIWFIVERDVTIGAGTIWNGNVLAGRTVTINSGSTVMGRALAGAAGAGALTLTGAAAPSVTSITVPQ